MARCYQLTAPFAVVGVEVDENGLCVRTAPIFKYILGWDIAKIAAYAEKRGWEMNPEYGHELDQMYAYYEGTD